MGNLVAVGMAGAPVMQEVRQDMFSSFISYLDASPKTVSTYTKALRSLFRYLGGHGISRPQREDVLAYRDALKDDGCKPATISLYMTAARLFFRWTAQKSLYPDIAEHIKGAKLDKSHKRDYLAASQVKTVLAGVDRETLMGKRDYAMLVLMTACGLRTIEVSRANVEDMGAVGSDAVLYVQGKGHEERSDFVKLPAEVEQAVRAYLAARGNADGGEPLFASLSRNGQGQRLSTRSISGMVKARMQAAGFSSSRLTAHSLRHTAVTLSLLAGKSLEEVKQFARHSSINTTLIYSHALDASQNTCSVAVASAIF